LKDKGNKDAQKLRTLKSKDSHNVIFSHLLNIYKPTPHASHLAHGMTPLLRSPVPLSPTQTGWLALSLLPGWLYGTLMTMAYLRYIAKTVGFRKTPHLQ
jgi:hypothetical protein